MSKVVSLFSVDSLGLTFLSWSLHYLGGHHAHYSCEKNEFLPLPENPIKELNAHTFLKNHPSGTEQTEEYISKLRSLNHCNFETIYAFPPHGENTTIIDFVNINETHRTAVFNQQQDSKKLTKLCANAGPLIISEIDPRNRTYHFNIRSLDKRLYVSGSYSSPDESRDHFNSIFFGKSLEYYKSNNLSTPWDIREMNALNLCIYPNIRIGDYVDLTIDHYYLSSNDLWVNLESEIFNVFDYIQESINHSRFELWKKVYTQWSKKQKDLNKFEWYLDHIIDCIVNNYYFDLGRLNLTPFQEAIIQHILIYQHDLTIKAWGLIKFPPNTQDLHKLLEPNFHKLTPY